MSSNDEVSDDSVDTRHEEPRHADAPPQLWTARHREKAERALCDALVARGIDVTEEGIFLQWDYDGPDDEELMGLLISWQHAVNMTRMQLGLAYMEPQFPASPAEREARVRRDYDEVRRLAREREALYDGWRAQRQAQVRTVSALPGDDGQPVHREHPDRNTDETSPG